MVTTSTAVLEVRGEHAVVSGEMSAGAWDGASVSDRLYGAIPCSP